MNQSKNKRNGHSEIIQPAKYNEELEMNPEAWVGKLVYIVTRAQTRRRKLPK